MSSNEDVILCVKPVTKRELSIRQTPSWWEQYRPGPPLPATANCFSDRPNTSVLNEHQDWRRRRFGRQSKSSPLTRQGTLELHSCCWAPSDPRPKQPRFLSLGHCRSTKPRVQVEPPWLWFQTARDNTHFRPLL